LNSDFLFDYLLLFLEILRLS